MTDKRTSDDEPEEPTPDGEAPIIDVTPWFNQQREVVLEIEGVRYRLRLTRRNKLILQK